MNIDAKILNKKKEQNKISSILRGLNIMTKWSLFPKCKDGSTYETRSMDYTILTERRGESPTMISIDAETASVKIKYLYLTKTDGIYLNITKAIY